MDERSADYRNFLNPNLVSKLNSLELKAKLIVEGFKVGLHRSPYHGFSVEFSEHRPYMQGDDLKNVDWKVLAKTERYYIKQYEEETNLKSYILLDSSNSMNFSSTGNIKKIDYAVTLAASLAYLLNSQQDAVGLASFAEKLNVFYPPKTSKVYLHNILKYLASLKASSKTNCAGSLNSIAEKISRRGLVIIISDLLDDLENLIKAIKHFRYNKNEVIIFQILDPLEKSFAFGNDSIFVDMETKEEITTQPYHIQKAYQKSMNDFLNKIKSECLNSSIDYNLVETNYSFDKALLSFIQKRSRLN